MASSARRVVVTGLGTINPVGLDAASYWQGLCQGKAGVRTIQMFDPGSLPCRIGGEIAGFKDARNYVDKDARKSLKVMARGIQLAVAAAHLALTDAGVDKAKLDPTRFGCEFGAGLLPTELQELGPAAKVTGNCKPGLVDLQKWGEQGLAAIPPLWMLKYLPNMLACHVSIIHNAQGPNNTITESDVASLLALGEAFHILRRDGADFFLAGGADSKINPLSLVRLSLFGKLSRRNDEPDKAVRPFDRQRDGSVIGEGGGVLVVEDLDHARRRGGGIYAEMVGFGTAFDFNKTGKGLVRAMRAALAQAAIAPDDVDHVNAHGLSSVTADAWEAKAINEVFGACSRPVPVFAPKSYYGNLGAGSGTSELAASLLALHHGQLPATLNYQEPDPACPVPVARTMQPVTRPHMLKLGFTELGQCAALVFRKWDS